MRKLVILLILVSGLAKAQVNQFVSRNILFDQTAGLRNAALIDSSTSFLFGNQSLFGPFSNVRGFYAQGNYHLKRTKLHNVGLQFSSEREGALIAINRVSMHYALRFSLTDGMHLSLGAEAGIVNFALQGTSTTPGGNDLAGNLALSVAAFWPLLKIGVSRKPVNRSVVSPVNAVLTFESEWGIYAQRQLLKRGDHELQLRGQYLHSSWGNLPSVKVLYLYKEKALTGVAVSSNQLAFEIGINRLPVNIVNLSTSVAYQVPVSDDLSTQFTPLQIHFKISGNDQYN